MFSKVSWHQVDQDLQQKIGQEINAFDANRLLSTDEQAMITYFVDKFRLEMPVLADDSEITADQREITIERQFRGYEAQFDRFGGGTVPGLEYEFDVPYKGDGGLFDVEPTTSWSNRPSADIKPEHLIITISGPAPLPAERVAAQLQGHVASIKQHLQALGQSVENFNNHLPNRVTTAVKARRDKLMADRNALAGLGFKIKDRAGAARTYATPEVRRKIVPTLPPASSTPWEPEPTISDDIYEHILKVIGDCAILMERSPSAFEGLGEEALRDHFLFLLNGHLEGMATGETFNKGGKTDILVRQQNRNLFIGECKFWGGPKVLTETIEQLLGYTSWRDTKVAVIVFNRNKDFSAVLAQVRSTVEAHPNCKRFVAKKGETRFDFIFGQKEDAQREMKVAVVLFDVPQP